MGNVCCAPKSQPFYVNKLFLIATFGLFSVLISAFFPQTVDVYHYFIEMFKLVWWAMVLGFIIGGIIDYFIPQDYIQKVLSKSKKRTLLLAVLLGALLSTCCHGILAISMQLYKKGASVPAIVTLLMAAPWANFSTTILMVVFFKLKGLLIIGLSIVIALIVGFIFQQLQKRKLLDSSANISVNKEFSFSIRADIKKRYKHYNFSKSQLLTDLKGVSAGSWDLMKMVLWWFVIAMVISSYIAAFVPHGFVAEYFGPSFMGLLSTLAATSIIEICSEGSSVLAFELYNQTGSIASVFVFLLAGVATDFTEIGLIWSTIGKRTAILIPLISVPIIMFFACLLLFL
tara:strand:- start:1147 stop:2175 length:1029 start_codon:yes stop_codon:yes gene_type:complete